MFVPHALAAALCTALAAHALPAASSDLAPLLTPTLPAIPHEQQHTTPTLAHIVEDSYIVVLDESLSDNDIDHHHQLVDAVHSTTEHALAQASSAHARRHGVKHRFHVGGKRHSHARRRSSARKLKGYSGSFDERTVDHIRAMKGVKYVERDSLVWASDVEKGAPWGLARISHRNTLSLGNFNRYEYDSQAGEGVDAYVIDTGVNIDHVELEGRAKWGKTIPNDPDQDLNGHGSHVAGTIASAKYGVAKKANIVAVKVLGAGGSGTMSDVVAGVAWAADSAAEQANLKAQGKNKKHKGSVANMSLGGGKSQALDDAVNAAVEDGLHFAVAAGNDNRDACSYSPAAAEGAITVGASTISDERAYFSNHGKCVDIFAPGLNILSIWNSGNRSVNTISGTSMASPHIAGLAAYMLGSDWAASAALDEALSSTSSQSSFASSLNQFAFGGLKGKPEDHLLSPKALKKAMLKIATKGALHDLNPGSPNLLSFNKVKRSYTAPSSSPPKRGKWRTDSSEVESSLVEAYLEDLKDELESLKSELRDEIEEVSGLVRELVEEAF
ncbi:proteinase B [Rhodotorula toruloides]|uniref:Autophagic serine protease Alp2 n=1 Tax=Rhodotorula toruloides (strain NP11) TaxID=1130832 RepID=M7X568_RHOT1|nr:autophagic serine protease Alp2 [Rhodotorula toruloides NP11]EMS18794.1 autophagic serine protease Alp2 [Rhodotorula toruloides NP11]